MGEAYAAGKARRKNMTNSSDHVPAKDSCGRIFLDIFTINSPKEIKVSVNNPHCRIMVDDNIGLKF